jgi:VanZ family protein
MSSYLAVIRPSGKTIWLWYWGPAMLWALAIAAFSTATFGSHHTGAVLSAVLRLLHIHLLPAQFDFLHGVIRKGAHFTVYGILSGLIFRASRGTWPSVRRWQFNWAMMALGLSLATASADEFHQLFSPGRTGTWKDVVLDMVGACFVQTLIVVMTAGNRNRRSGPPGALGSGDSGGRTKDVLTPLSASPS